MRRKRMAEAQSIQHAYSEPDAKEDKDRFGDDKDRLKHSTAIQKESGFNSVRNSGIYTSLSAKQQQNRVDQPNLSRIQVT